MLEGFGGHARVLLVDGDPISALVVKRYFDSQGIKVDHALTGSQALEWHRRNRYKLVIADWLLEELDGIDLCRQLREGNPDYVYFILCSTKSDKTDVREAYEAGIDDFLAKPLEQGHLVQRLKVARRILSTETNLQEQRLQLQHSGETLRAMNQSLMHASRRFEELFSGLPIACFTLDCSGLIHEWNRQAERDFGIATHLAFQRPVWEVLCQATNGFWSEEMVEEVAAGAVLENLDWTLRMEDDEERNFVCNLISLRDPKGNLVGAVCANLDITERKRAEKRIDEQMGTINEYAQKLRNQRKELIQANRSLAQQAITDSMTGLINHRGFQEELGRAFERRERLGTSLSLILMDIDYFKLFNDSYGHQAGDDLLATFGALLKRETRKHEPAARYGGEEFAVILEGAEMESAIQAADRLKKAIHQFQWEQRPVTASFGIATVHEGIDREELIRRADIALYESKRQGRDRVTHFSNIHSNCDAA